jgi:hypothetical protein
MVVLTMLYNLEASKTMRERVMVSLASLSVAGEAAFPPGVMKTEATEGVGYVD